MSSELFREMLEYERMHPDVRQNELQSIFNVNRSTYWRWKKKIHVKLRKKIPKKHTKINLDV